jgi:hypothetical protein
MQQLCPFSGGGRGQCEAGRWQWPVWPTLEREEEEGGWVGEKAEWAG